MAFSIRLDVSDWLGQIRSDWIRLYQIWSDWIRLGQIGSDWIRLNQIGPDWTLAFVKTYI